LAVGLGALEGVSSAAGAVVGIEVKASATVTCSDFEGLRRLRDAAGAAFVTGVALAGCKHG
jgi:hypothetical protein